MCKCVWSIRLLGLLPHQIILTKANNERRHLLSRFFGMVHSMKRNWWDSSWSFAISYVFLSFTLSFCLSLECVGLFGIFGHYAVFGSSVYTPHKHILLIWPPKSHLPNRIWATWPKSIYLFVFESKEQIMVRKLRKSNISNKNIDCFEFKNKHRLEELWEENDLYTNSMNCSNFSTNLPTSYLRYGNLYPNQYI